MWQQHSGNHNLFVLHIYPAAKLKSATAESSFFVAMSSADFFFFQVSVKAEISC